MSGTTAWMLASPIVGSDSSSPYRRSTTLGGIVRQPRLRLGQAQHPERVEQAEQSGQDRHEQRDLERAMGGLVVDPHDLLAYRRRLALQRLVEVGGAHHLSIVLELVGDRRLTLGRDHLARLGEIVEAEDEGR